ncbi:MAG TPA: hypothetical protein VGZ22_16500, partial [Isosphaeraceae bacterium]|nr:hypothetical protein [Isosphaeraceae bacterium]
DRSLDGDKAGSAITSDTTWKARRAQVPADASAWGLVRIDRLKALDPKKFQVPHQPNPGATFLFGHWLEALRQAPWLAASVTWTADRMRAEIALPTPASGYSDEWKKFLPPAESGGAAVAPHPPGTIACLSLWRDLAAIWEVRADLFSPETVQNLTKLDSFAGQFFAGRDFGTGVLGSLAGDWRLVIAHQDYAAMNPVPDVKLPAFALVINLKPGDDEFAQRLKVAFQTFIGLANVGGAQSKAPPLMLGSEEYEGVSIATARFMPPKDALPKDASVHQRHNFSPSAMQVGDHFVLSSSTGLARSLAKTLKEPRKPTDVTLLAEVDPTELAKLVEVNKSRLVMQNMLQKGNDKAAAEKEIGLLTSLLQYVGLATLSAKDGAEAVQLHLNVSIPAR